MNKMKYYINDKGSLIQTIGKLDLQEITKEKFDELTNERIVLMESQYELQFWQNISYEEAVDMKIREKYTASQEFAILRQRDEKPTEYQEYYAYCEECKAFVKTKKGIE